MLPWGRLLMTASTLGVGLGPVLLELGDTHLFNPAWPPHARFHLIWFVAANAFVGLLATFVLWRPWPDASRGANLALALNLAVLAGFTVAAVLHPLYGGALVEGDPGTVLGVQPNVLVFVALGVFALLGRRLIAQASSPAGSRH
ncbi:MAG: DUF6640 family protein [Sandaracinaceae bacterium]